MTMVYPNGAQRPKPTKTMQRFKPTNKHILQFVLLVVVALSSTSNFMAYPALIIPTISSTWQTGGDDYPRPQSQPHQRQRQQNPPMWPEMPPPPDVEDRDVCELSKTNFTAASGLLCIVTGMEHSGTTIMIQLIMSDPHVFGGLECGMLEKSQPAEFRQSVPFYKWMGEPHHFGFTEAQRDALLPTSSCFAQMYRRTLEHSQFFQLPTTRDSWIIDKTPRYVRMLDAVMDRAPGVPVIVTQKSDDDQVRSIVKHMSVKGHPNENETDMRKRKLARMFMRRAKDGLERAVNKYGIYDDDDNDNENNNSHGRILIVNTTQLYQDPSTTMTRVYNFLHLNWKDEYLTMDALNLKRSNVGNTNKLASFDRKALQNKNVTQKMVVN
mmetsp:Transcript_21470/g.61326  ORF Transcript_21470/g.61326 Transcript_21470/m.61326 type:complete len:381 (-) Transcript_21470:4285-5427(-)